MDYKHFILAFAAVIATASLASSTTYISDTYVNTTGTVNATAGIQTAGNATASYFIGSGKYLTDVTYTDTWAGNQTNYYTITQSNATYVNFTGYNKTSWDTAYGWGNHATQGYLKTVSGLTSSNITGYNNANWDTSFTYVTNSTFYLASNPYSFYNSTTIPAYYPQSNPYGFYNSTNFVISDYYLKSNPYSYYNSTTIPAYYLQSNPYGYYNATTIPAYLTAENDPKLAVLTANKWCTANSTGNGINCTANPPSGAETDPYWTANQSSYVSWAAGNLSYMNFSSPLPCSRFTGNATNLCTITQGVTSESDPSWSGNYTACSSSQKLYFNGRNLACNNDVGITTETDPKIAVLTANKWCIANSTGTGINCTANAPITTETDPYWTSNYTACTSSQKLYFSGTSLACANDLGITTETDPKVATLTANKWCIANSTGTGINCTADTPSTDLSSYYTKTQGNSTYLKYSEVVNCTGSQVLQTYGTCITPSGSGNISGAGSSGQLAQWSATAGYIGGISFLSCTGSNNFTTGLGTCGQPSGFLTSETWPSNYTACSSTQKLYFDANKNLACNDDLGGAEVDPFNPAKNASFYAWQCDFTPAAATTMCPGWTGAPISTGTNVANTTDPEKANHPGIVTFRSSTTTNSGYQFSTEATQYLIAGGEQTQFIFKALNMSAGRWIRMGFQDTVTTTLPTDGVYFNITGATLAGVCRAGGSQTATGSTYTITGNTWYKGTIIVNASATNVTFRVQSAAGSVLWEDYCITNIPTGATRYTGHSVAGFLIGTAAADVMSIDYMSVYINRQLVR